MFSERVSQHRSKAIVCLMAELLQNQRTEAGSIKDSFDTTNNSVEGVVVCFDRN